MIPPYSISASTSGLTQVAFEAAQLLERPSDNDAARWVNGSHKKIFGYL